GYASGYPIGQNFGLARCTPDGALDAGFGAGGVVVTDLGGNDVARALVAVPSSRDIIAVGDTGSHPARIAVVHYRADGSLDPFFGSGGWVTTDLGSETHGNAVAVQHDGKVVVGGSAPMGTQQSVAVVRYNAGGTLDSSFALEGRVITPAAGPEVDALQIQP